MLKVLSLVSQMPLESNLIGKKECSIGPMLMMTKLNVPILMEVGDRLL